MVVVEVVVEVVVVVVVVVVVEDVVEVEVVPASLIIKECVKKNYKNASI